MSKKFFPYESSHGSLWKTCMEDHKETSWSEKIPNGSNILYKLYNSLDLNFSSHFTSEVSVKCLLLFSVRKKSKRYERARKKNTNIDWGYFGHFLALSGQHNNRLAV